MATNLITATDSSFDDLLKSKELVIVDFWAEWCGPCRMLAPTIDEVAKEYAGKVIVAKLNVDENTLTASKWRIMSIPTLIFFKDGNEVDKIIGVVSKNDLKKRIDNLIVND